MAVKPLRLQHNKESAIALRETVNSMPYANFKLFIRSENLTPIGVLTKKNNVMDSRTGRLRTEACGTAFDGSRILEYIDWMNSMTGRIESCIVFENDHFLVTARKSSDPSDDRNNFLWLVLNPVAGDGIKEAHDRMIASQGTIQRLDKELENARETADFYKSQADISANELRNLGKRYNLLTKEHTELVSISRYLYDQVLKERGGEFGSIEREATMQEQLKNAHRRGEIKGATAESFMKKHIKDWVEVNEPLALAHVTNRSSFEKAQLMETQGKLKEIEERIAGLSPPMKKPQQEGGGAAK